MLGATLHEQEIRRIIGAPGGGDRVTDAVAALNDIRNRCLYFVNHELTIDVRDSLISRNDCIVIVRSGSPLVGALGDCRVLETAQPRAAIAKILEFIRSEGRQQPWIDSRVVAHDAVISPLAFVDGNVRIGAGVRIEPFCTVGPDVVLGRRSVVRSGARIYPRVSIGEESVIGANAVIGSEGFGFVRDETGNKRRIPHLGGVIIGSHVEIGALSVVQYGTIHPTIVEDYTKIDDNVEIGHNARIGRGASVTGGVVIGGSAVIGAEAWIGINSSVRNGHRIGSHALVGMDVSVQSDLADKAVARAHRPDISDRGDYDPTSIGFTGRTRGR